jgi:hypothetical protein
MTAGRNTVNEAIEAWRARDEDEREDFLGWAQARVDRWQPGDSDMHLIDVWLDALALLRAAAEPEANWREQEASALEALHAQFADGTMRRRAEEAAKAACSCTVTRHERQENRACPVHFPKAEPEASCPTCRGAGIVDGTISYRRCPTCKAEPEAKALPDTRVYDPTSPKCACTFEERDSECFVHPSCACCGEATTVPVGYCIQCTRAGKDISR